jgi:thiamine-phosphate pyrophosphorylase
MTTEHNEAPASRRQALPRLYCIVDAACFTAEADVTVALTNFTRELVSGGARLIQYRDKEAAAGVALSRAREVARVARSVDSPLTLHREGSASIGPARVLLILNDRPDLALGAAFDGVHVGQDDLSPIAARRIVGADRIVGVSTHTPDQVVAADATDCDYIAIGPVFATTSKRNPDPVIGLEAIRTARALTRKPLVAIGAITRSNAAEVFAAGADSIAVISDLLSDPRRAVEELLRIAAAPP